MKKTAKAMGISNPASGRNFIKAIIKKEIVSPLAAIKLTLSHFPRIFLSAAYPCSNLSRSFESAFFSILLT